MTNTQAPAAPGAVTQLLRSVRAGDRDAFDRLFAVVHDELRQIARRQLRGGGRDTIRATELVHELYLKMVEQVDVEWASRAHFYGIAGRAMRQILVDLARRRKAAKRGGEWIHTTLTGEHASDEARLDEVLALNDLLEQLDERQRLIVEYRFFAGMTEEEIAEVLGLSSRTVQREWVKARAWLYRALYDGG